ncbi:MAG: AMP-binding protein [Melioribacteraceae bacterium]|nr:AMP-binding protein [Melioribacteraceae bacterium]
MLTDNKQKELLKEYESIRDQFFAGKSSLEEKELEDLVFRFIHELEGIYQRKLFSENEEAIKIWRDIFESALPSRIAHSLLERIEPNVMYSFGKYLNDLLIEGKKDNEFTRKIAHSFLDLIRFPVFLVNIYENPKWEALIFEILRSSQFTIPVLFEQRLNYYSNKPLFTTIRNNKTTSLKWSDAAARIETYSDAIYTYLKGNDIIDSKVAFLTDNSLKMALLDLACLTSGIVNVMLPANSVSEHIKFILNETETQLIFLSDEKQLAKVKSIKASLPNLKLAILLEGNSTEEWVISLKSFVDNREHNLDSFIRDRRDSINIDDLATIMYTSGTTGEPKGIMFSQQNIVYKRFCRALAIPPIGDKDKFLAYLPLFHTFGRYLEMMGSVFWGAEYVFMENPSVDTMISNMQLVKPTIFISIPKKWSQLYEEISKLIDLELAEEENIRNKVNELSGGKLKWGLSAAGYLSPEVFQFFQKYDVELMSGFGMTEATGGISMTPPGEYKPNSLGKELPGIEMKLGDDGELLIRGPYVMTGYYGEDKNETFTDGWLPTGDIMLMDEKGYIQIIDRKKEIYKNIKGETIAPQKIENLFRDFETIKQVFLVGDHRPFNTALIYPDLENENSVIRGMQENELNEYFSSVIVSVNTFLAPFERIVDFRIIDRLFAKEHGELTAKGTFRRRIIEKNFESKIAEMYEKTHTILKMEGTELRIPNWFLREMGCLSSDISIKDFEIKISKIERSLIIKRIEENIFRVGSYLYEVRKHYIDFQHFLINPSYWLGNKELFDFTSDAIIQWQRHSKEEDSIIFRGLNEHLTIETSLTDNLKEILRAGENSIFGLHLAVMHLQSNDFERAKLGIEYSEQILSDETSNAYKFGLQFVKSVQLKADIKIVRKTCALCLRHIEPDSIYKILTSYLEKFPNLIEDEIINSFVERKGDEVLEIIKKILEETVQFNLNHRNVPSTSIAGMFRILESYSVHHPASYKFIRQVIVKYQLMKDWPELVEFANQARLKIQSGFRDWLGVNQTVAVDPETGEEYGWKDVIILEDNIDSDDGRRITETIEKSSILREAVFLMSKATILRLHAIPPGGIWISNLSFREDRSVYRIAIQTRFFGSFDLVFYLNKTTPREQIEDEIEWLIVSNALPLDKKLVGQFGGYWEEFGVWCEEYISGDSVHRSIQRHLRKKENLIRNRMSYMWPFFIWNAASAYMNFWKITGFKIQLAEPSSLQISVPSHDYQIGTRLLSIGNRVESDKIEVFFQNFYDSFVPRNLKEFEELDSKDVWKYMYAGVIDALGKEEGLKVLRTYEKYLLENEVDSAALENLQNYLNYVTTFGFIPKQLYFAIKRFHRWTYLNKNATYNAQADMLSELYSTYMLDFLEDEYPATRARFFLETVFADSNQHFTKILRSIILQLRKREINRAKSIQMISDIQTEIQLTEKEEYFIPRLSYPHLKSSDDAVIIKGVAEGEGKSNLVVEVEDYDGQSYLIRRPISPKEISKLHQLFISANLLVNFRPEHKYLVAVSERGFIIGGLFFNYVDAHHVHMDKIVVSDRYRRKGISEGLMREFFSRLKDKKVSAVSTGFFRPEYFYKFGFKIEKKYSGLVKNLVSD